MTIINFSKEEKNQMIPLIQQYMDKELNHEIGQFDAEFLLDFFSEQIGGYMYNRALTDVHALLSNHLDTISDSIYNLEKRVPTIRRQD